MYHNGVKITDRDLKKIKKEQTKKDKKTHLPLKWLFCLQADAYLDEGFVPPLHPQLVYK